MMTEEMQHPNPARHLYPGLDLHRGPDSKPTKPISDSRPHIERLVDGQREGLHGEGSSHVLALARGDLSGGDEHEAHLTSAVEELEGAVVVGKDGPVGVEDGDVLREGEVNGAVSHGEGGQLDGVDCEVNVLGLEDGEVNNEDDYDNENQENGCHYA